jgi:GTPase SAR1 family protein
VEITLSAQRQQVQLRETTKSAYEILQEKIDLDTSNGTICLVGDFLSGKTTLVKQFLEDRFENPEDYYLNVNLYLLKQLKKEEELSNLVLTKAKARLIMQVTLEEAIRKHFEEYDLLVLDAIEIIYPYNLNLITITNKYARSGKICIICVPENKERGFIFDFSWGICEVILLESKLSRGQFSEMTEC